jgi:O-antigen ligase
MKRIGNLFRRRFSPAALASCALVVAGLILGTTVDMAWMLLFAMGVFGPVLLREFGILRDRDEFQREAAFRAGYRAYLIGGAFLAGVLIAKSRGHANLEHDQVHASSG